MLTVRASSVAVVIVTHNSADVVGSCLDSLADGLAGVARSSVIVVDNHSTDETCSIARRHPQPSRVVRLGRNRGYAAGINAGAACAGDADALLVLNPDARLAPGCVATLASTLALPATGIAVPMIHDADGTVNRSLRRMPTVRRIWGEALLGGVRAGRFESLSEIIEPPARYRAPGVVDWASGAVMLVSRRCHEAVGGWDESFFLYSEETDFCLRARDHGWLVRYTPAASAVHIGGHGERTPLRALMVANRMEVFRRRNDGLRSGAYRAGLALHEVLRAGRGPHYRAAAWMLLVGRPGASPGWSARTVGRPCARRRLRGVAR